MIIDAAYALDPPISVMLAAWDQGAVSDLAKGSAELRAGVDRIVKLHGEQRQRLPASLRPAFAAAVSEAERDIEAVARLEDGTGSSSELDAWWEAMRDLYRMPAALRELIAAEFPDTAACGASPRPTERPTRSGSVTISVGFPQARTWQAEATCWDASEDGRIDGVTADLAEGGQQLEFYLNPENDPPIFELSRSGALVGYMATTQDRCMVAEVLAADLASGRFRFTGLPPELNGGFLRPADAALDGTIQWTCRD